MFAGKLRSDKLTTLLAGVLVAGGLLLPAAVTAQSVYTIDDLGVLPGDTSSVSQGINELGDVVGWSNGPGGARPFVFTDPTGMTALAPFPGGSANGVARDINENGEVVGQWTLFGGPPHAVRWTGGVPEDLGAIPDSQFSEAMGINALGDVVGDNGTTSITGTMEAFTYVDPDPMAAIALPFRGRGRDINDSGQVTGYMTGAANRAFRTYFARLSLCARKYSATYFLHDPNGLLPAGFDSSRLPCAGGSDRDKPAGLPRAKIAGPNARQIFPRCVPLGIRGDSRLLTFYLTRTDQSRRTAT